MNYRAKFVALGRATRVGGLSRGTLTTLVRRFPGRKF